MKDLTKYFIDLSKLSEEQQKRIISMLPVSEFDSDYQISVKYHFLHFLYINKWYVGRLGEILDKTELTYHEFIKLFKGEEGENPYRPMTEFPPITEGEQHSKMVLVFDEDLNDCDLGFYDFELQKWVVMGGFQMELICWQHIEKPMYEDVQEYKTILTD